MRLSMNHRAVALRIVLDMADTMNKNIFILGEWIGHDLAHSARL